jgi:LAS superfamily LD-carboxypeptidase LdcB
MPVAKEILWGKTNAHVEALEGTPYFLHREMLAPFRRLCQRARAEGIDLSVASGFRDHAAQLRIWNAKATGQRALLDREGRPLEFAKLSEEQIVWAILRWSALPGGSRHHWGTDIDIYDRNSLPEGYRLQLIPQEASTGGVQEKFARWLKANLAAEGFFRPYENDRGGVSPEWWHISYRPISGSYYQAFTLDILEEAIQDTDLELKAVVLARLPEIYERYIRNISS